MMLLSSRNRTPLQTFCPRAFPEKVRGPVSRVLEISFLRHLSLSDSGLGCGDRTESIPGAVEGAHGIVEVIAGGQGPEMDSADSPHSPSR